MSTYLAIDDLTVRYGANEVLKSLSLGVEAGTLVALLGSSGCGKTTLLRAISGFAQPSAGRIHLAGRDITDTPPEKRNTAMVFQSYALWPHMTVFDNMAYGLKLRRRPRSEIAARIDGLLSLLHLEGLAGRKATELSGGQRQRVALGRALAVDPDVLLLDEPLSSLDARIRVELRAEIKAVQSRVGITAVHVTHDREEAMVMADRIVVLRDGRIEQEGTPEEVYHRPATPFVASFMGADNVIALDIAEADGAILATFDEAGATSSARLPVGPGGAYLAAPSVEGRVDAHFRAEAVRLAGPDEDVPPDCLTLPAILTQTSYPGGAWRYAVATGAHRFVIDDARRYAAGDRIRVVLPASALHLFPAVPPTRLAS
jgi:ABC-type Fe3+/spermidine/putrescine transport system ATPase subunit